MPNGHMLSCWVPLKKLHMGRYSLEEAGVGLLGEHRAQVVLGSREKPQCPHRNLQGQTPEVVSVSISSRSECSRKMPRPSCTSSFQVQQ